MQYLINELQRLMEINGALLAERDRLKAEAEQGWAAVTEENKRVTAKMQRLWDALAWIASHSLATDPPELAAYQMQDIARKALSEEVSQ